SNSANMTLRSSDPNQQNNRATADIAVMESGGPPPHTPAPTQPGGATPTATPTPTPHATTTPTVNGTTSTPVVTVPHSTPTPSPTGGFNPKSAANCDGHFDVMDVLAILTDAGGVPS